MLTHNSTRCKIYAMVILPSKNNLLREKAIILFCVLFSLVLIVVSSWIYFWTFGILAGIALIFLALAYAKYQDQIKAFIRKTLFSMANSI